MQKLISLFIVAGMIIFIACGPNKDGEKAKKLKDSLVADSIKKDSNLKAKIIKKKADSIKQIAIKDSIDSVAVSKKSSQPKTQELNWNDGFLEGIYINSSNVAGSIYDSLMDCICLARGRQVIENGIIQYSIFCEKNGIFAKNGIKLPDGSAEIVIKTVKIEKGTLYGFKFSNGDKKAPYILQKLLKIKLKY